MVRRTKEEALETRQQIVEAAEHAFYERGVANTTLADIATRAGVTRGAIYWHFSNKADVLQALLDSLSEPLEDLARASESEDEPDPLGCMQALLIKLFQGVSLDPKTRRINEILFHKCEFTNEMCDLRQQRARVTAECDERIECTLRNAVNRNQLPANLDTRRAALAMHAFIDGHLALWLLVPDSQRLDEEAPRLVACIIDMLRFSPALLKGDWPSGTAAQ
ncbi:MULTISPECIES: TetR family transcriptional regulator [Pseudomonas]|uniref:TetR family transcriptional regulator n=1 Tax=Pseudomonas quercus TaxID=2722792 RepID=A0ABX0YE38_9PSED|nr:MULTISPECIES: TetR family transcriptional regulator [Pseudomonas]MBF7141754.1 TetR family transcriptional regulator [Pseudomonas sp. LY10J]NJP00293.1 TetR family transcriptional regulator [Pseudomonas quercus]